MLSFCRSMPPAPEVCRHATLTSSRALYRHGCLRRPMHHFHKGMAGQEARMQVTLLAYRLHVLSVPAEHLARMAFPLVRLLAQASAGER